MRPVEARIYRIRYEIAEAIFLFAALVKPRNYEFEAVRAAAHLVLEAIHNQQITPQEE